MLSGHDVKEINLSAYFASPYDRVPPAHALVNGEQRTFTLTLSSPVPLSNQGGHNRRQHITYHIRQTWDANPDNPGWREPTIMGFVLKCSAELLSWDTGRSAQSS